MFLRNTLQQYHYLNMLECLSNVFPDSQYAINLCLASLNDYIEKQPECVIEEYESSSEDNEEYQYPLNMLTMDYDDQTENNISTSLFAEEENEEKTWAKLKSNILHFMDMQRFNEKNTSMGKNTKEKDTFSELIELIEQLQQAAENVTAEEARNEVNDVSENNINTLNDDNIAENKYSTDSFANLKKEKNDWELLKAALLQLDSIQSIQQNEKKIGTKKPIDEEDLDYNSELDSIECELEIDNDHLNEVNTKNNQHELKNDTVGVNALIENSSHDSELNDYDLDDRNTKNNHVELESDAGLGYSLEENHSENSSSEEMELDSYEDTSKMINDFNDWMTNFISLIEKQNEKNKDSIAHDALKPKTRENVTKSKEHGAKWKENHQSNDTLHEILQKVKTKEKDQKETKKSHELSNRAIHGLFSHQKPTHQKQVLPQKNFHYYRSR